MDGSSAAKVAGASDGPPIAPAWKSAGRFSPAHDALSTACDDAVGVNAREVELTSARLDDLGRRVREKGALGFGALGIALAASWLAPSVAVPLLVGGLVLVTMALADTVRRADVIASLAADPDAQSIPAVRRRAALLARPAARKELAATIRLSLEAPSPSPAVAFCRPELEELAAKLDAPDWEPDPPTAAGCRALLVDGFESPLTNPLVEPALTRSRLRRLLTGFRQVGTPQPGTAAPPVAA
jgi:hypothetical protein